jgi:hypothetical protein
MPLGILLQSSGEKLQFARRIGVANTAMNAPKKM